MSPQTETNMGFGILFIGYFLIFNFPYCEFTDALAAALMMYALYKLSRINEGFRLAFLASVGFTALGAAELIIALFDSLSPIAQSSPLLFVPALLRHLVIGLLTFLMLGGMSDVADEVGLRPLSKKCKIYSFVTIGMYSINILLESALLASVIDGRILAVAYVSAIMLTLGVIIMNLGAIYSCYMRICMPEDKDMSERESRFAFVNAFRRHEEEKQKEYQEYRLEKLKQKQNKRKKK